MNRTFITLLALVAAVSTARRELPEGATILDPDIVWDPVSVDSAAISPDRTLIAYVSKGAIWTCSVTSGPPKKLADLPDTITAFLAAPEYRFALERFGYVAPNPGYEPIPQLRGQVLQSFGLQWTPSQDGVIYTLRHRQKMNSIRSAYRLTYLSVDGVATEVALIEGDFTAAGLFATLHTTLH